MMIGEMKIAQNMKTKTRNERLPQIWCEKSGKAKVAWAACLVIRARANVPRIQTELMKLEEVISLPSTATELSECLVFGKNPKQPVKEKHALFD